MQRHRRPHRRRHHRQPSPHSRHRRHHRPRTLRPLRHRLKGATRIRYLGLPLLALVLASGGAQAWTIEAGVTFTDTETTDTPTDDTTVTFANDEEVGDLGVVFNADGSWSIDGFGTDFEPDTGAWAWNLTNWTPPFNVTHQGNITQQGTIRFTSFSGFYEVRGLSGYPTITVQGPTFTINLLPGNQTWSVVPVAISTSGLRMLISSAYDAPSGTIASTVSLLDATGNPLVGASINHTILDPDGNLVSGVTMTASLIPGIYLANVTIPQASPDGHYTTAAIYGGTVQSATIVKQPTGGLNGMLETALDQYLPLLIWGGLLLLSLYLNAWLPGTLTIMSFLNSLLPTPLWSMSASAMFILLGWAIHGLVVNGLIPMPFKKRAKT